MERSFQLIAMDCADPAQFNPTCFADSVTMVMPDGKMSENYILIAGGGGADFPAMQWIVALCLLNPSCQGQEPWG